MRFNNKIYQMKRVLLSIGVMLGMVASGQQLRYLDEVYSNVTVMNDIEYGVNIDFLTSDLTDQAQVAADITEIKSALALGNPIPAKFYDPTDTASDVKVASLKVDFYEPTGDTATARPLIIYIHTGNFLPPPINGGPTGTRQDSVGIVQCTNWAKRGFAAASVSYRLGWNPLAPTALERRGQLLNAVYRAIHDVKQLVRVMKANAATYKIDPSQIVLYGQGSGGYVSLAYASMDKWSELEIPKFINPLTQQSYVDSNLVGNLEGFGGLLNLYAPNGESSDIAFTVNTGGALADTSWLEAGDAPVVSFQCVRDAFAPFDEGTVIVPTTNEDVVDVQGANVFIDKANTLGNNTYNSRTYTDPITMKAQGRYGQTIDYIYPAPNDMITIRQNLDGLFPVIKPLGASLFQNQSSPWEWWDPNSPTASAVIDPGPPPITAHQAGLLSNPDMSPMQGRTYLDTINGYAIPRIMVSLQLPGYDQISVEEYGVLNGVVSMFPNPTSNTLTISWTEATSREGLTIEVIDLTGRAVMSEDGFRGGERVLNVSALTPGAYLVRLSGQEGVFTDRVIVR
ncbi:MAG: hypothetical protein SchgKO_22420 [Schleiferiaceae bacterium]